jgi:peptidoglycan/LPS O-acetylase OafA/YrhL
MPSLLVKIRSVARPILLAQRAFARLRHAATARQTVDPGLPAGGLGVTVFFALSGYLITTLLLRERAERGVIGLRAFYIRRALRLYPALYVMLTATAIVAACGAISVSLVEWVSAALFIWNYSPDVSTFWLGHTWSLAIEEQFYLIWPLLTIRVSPRRLLQLCIAIGVISPILRVATYIWGDPQVDARIGIYLHTRSDALLWGCALALLPVVSPKMQTLLRTHLRWLLPLAIFELAITSTMSRTFGGGYRLPLGLTLDSLASTVVIAALVADTAPRLTRILSVPPLVWLGGISYRLYLWGQLFTGPWQSGPLTSDALAVSLSVATAALSFYLVERPFLKRKNKWARATIPTEGDPVRVG